MRKFLSLVLALAMTMSLVVVSSSAKEFTDNDELNYKEAVDVISEIGVVDGYADGSFNPQGGLTRGAAAKIICNLILGPTTAAELHADTRPFPDVAIDSEFAGYIAYCAQQGIISGYADGEFKAANPLTGYAFMKMLLGALGYSTDIEKYVGENWSINVAKQAIGIGLNAGLVDEFNGVDFVTREEAALYAFNTLKATLVDYENTITADVNGATVTISNNTAKPVTWSEGRNNDGNIKDDTFVQFAEEFFPDLVRDDDHTKFMEPANTWTYAKTEIGTYERTDLLVESYTTGVSGRDMYDLLKPGVIDHNDLEVYIDGVSAVGDGEVNVSFTTYDEFDKDNLVRSNTKDLGATGDGVLTKVYLDTDNDLITIVSINTWLAKATADYNEDTEYAPLTVYSAVTAQNKVVPEYFNVDVEQVANVVDVTEDTFYQVNISWKDERNFGEVVVLQDVETLEDSTISEYSSDNGNDDTLDAKVTSLTTGGEEYDANVKAYYDDEILYQYNENLLTDNTYNVYLDQYGYFLGVELFEGSKNYVFITGFDRNTSNLAVRTATAGAIFLDGTMDNIQVNVVDTDDNIRHAITDNSARDTNVELFVPWSTASSVNGLSTDWTDLNKDGVDGINNLNQWYTYTVDEDGVYTLKPCVRMTWTQYDPANAADAEYALRVWDGDDDAKIRTDSLSVWDWHPSDTTGTSNLGQYVYGEDATVFITVDLDDVDTTETEDRAITDVNGVYTGVQNVDLIINTDDEWAKDQGQVYTVYDSDGYVIAAVVIGEAEGATGNYAYILSQAKSERLADGTYYWTFDAVVDGAKQTMTARGSYNSTIARMNRGDVVELRMDGEYVVDVKPVDNIYYNYTQSVADYDVYYMSDRDDAMGEMSDTDPVIVNLKGNTLYITEDQVDVGLGIASGATAVVIQKENGSEKIHNCASVDAAITRLADADGIASNGKQYDGVIMAVLDSRGAATWVVFDSDTELKTGAQEGGYQRTGNVANLTADLPIDVDGDGDNDVTLKGASANITYTVPSDILGMMYATMDYTAPEWVADGSSVDVDVNVLYKGSIVDSMTFSGTVQDGKATLYASSTNPFTFSGWTDTDSFTFSATNEDFNLVKVMYFNDKLNEITDSMSSGTTKQVGVGASKSVTAVLKNTTAAGTSVAVNWTGATGATSDTSVTYGGLNTGYTESALNVAGNGPVTLWLDLNARADTFGIEVATGTASPNVALSNYGIEGATDKGLNLTIGFEVAPNHNGFSATTNYDTENITVKLDGNVTDAYRIRVTVADYGYVDITKGSGTTAAKLTNGKLLTVSGDIEIDFDDVTVEVVEEVMDIERVTWNGNTITMKLTAEMPASVMTAVNAWDKTDDVTAVADGDGAGEAPAFYKAEAVNATTIELTFSGELLAAGDKVTLANSSAAGLDQVAGTTGANKVTATGKTAETNNVIILAADGAASLGT